jgi:hypothetical protein
MNCKKRLEILLFPKIPVLLPQSKIQNPKSKIILPVCPQLKWKYYMTAAEAIAELHRDLQEVEEWRALSLEQAMRGLDDDNLPEYTEADLVEKWQ